jgi:hypothetical protein
MKTYIEMLVMQLLIPGRYEEIKEYIKLKKHHTFLVDIDSIKSIIDRYNLEGVSENNIQEFIKKISLIEYYKVIGDFAVVNEMELELKVLKRDIIIESIIYNKIRINYNGSDMSDPTLQNLQ